jgi:hypothetical protein
MTIKERDNKLPNISKIDIYNQIPIPTKKSKNNEIPSQRNIKINYVKISQNTKNKKINKRTKGRKSSSKKEESKENNSEFSLPKTKIRNLTKKNDEKSILKSNDIKRNINFDEDNKRIDEVKNIEKDREINNNLSILIIFLI